MGRSRGAAEPREALEAGESGNRRAAIEAHAVGQRPHDRPIAPRRQFSQARRQVVERHELRGNPIPSQRAGDFVDKKRKIARLGEIDGDLGGDLGRVTERFEPAARLLFGLESDHDVGERRGRALARGRVRAQGA